MAEPGAAGFDIRRLLLTVGVVVVISFSGLFFLYRGCSSVPIGGTKPGYVIIYSNLELKDAATAIARLKEINIPYEIRDGGSAIAVPKDKADQAKIGLAEKNLPVGGSVGWEIFDQSRLGATDFDRRIQLIRAISGELSRTIRRIEGVEDARVQVVIPETKLFSVSNAPVTAAVLLKLAPGFELSPEKVKGIIHLVASSVENLQVENVTVIDETGRILSAKEALAAKQVLIPPPPPAETIPTIIATPEVVAAAIATSTTISQATTTTLKAVEQRILTKTKTITQQRPIKQVVSPEVVVTITPATAEVTQVKPTLAKKSGKMTAEERILLKATIKKNYEQEYSGKVQALLNSYYPPNAVIAKVRVEFKPAKDAQLKARKVKIKRLVAVVLIDNRLSINPKLKKATFNTVAGAISYDKKRKDQIIMQKVPFHLATPLETTPLKGKKGTSPKEYFNFFKSFFGNFFWLAVGSLLLILIVWLFADLRKRRSEQYDEAGLEPMPAAPQTKTRPSAVDQIKNVAEKNPEAIANMLKKWLSE